MEPLDYEEFIIANRAEIDKDPLNYLLVFPTDDIEKNDIAKKISTVEMAKPEHEAEMDLHVNECLRSYNSNYTCLVKNYERFASFNLTHSRKNELTKIAKTSKQQDFEIDIQNQSEFIETSLNTNLSISNNLNENLSSQLNKNSSINNNPLALKRSSFMLNDLEKLDSDPILPYLFERIPIETIDKENENIRNKDRIESLFRFYPPQYDESQLVENRLLPEPLTEHQCNRILVKCTNLKFDLDIEPFWATMALYDLKEKRKVSENFSFDLNNDSLKHMLNIHQTHQDLSTQAKSCIFNITYPSHDLFLVIRIEKVLQQGDIGECAEPYVKAQQQSQSSIEKLQSNANQFCERLGKYRMPFVWTAINIMSILNNSTGNSSINPSHDSIYTSNTTNLTQKSSSLDRRSVTTLPNSNNSNQNTKNTNQQNSKQYEPARKPISLKDDSNNSNPSNKITDICLNASLASFKPIAISINTFFKQESDKLSDEDLFRCLNDLKKSTTLIKKLKCLPGSLKMEFSPFNYDLANISSLKLDNTYLNTLNNHFILSPELQLIKFSNNPSLYHSNTNNSQYLSISQHTHLLPIKEILEFPTYSVYEPNYSYRNLLYIYPLSINLCGANANRSAGGSSNGPATNSNSSSFLNSSSSSARNIAIKVNFMKGEEGEHCAIPVFFAKSSSSLEYCKEVFVNVVYHNKTPQYHDEIKIKLPALLSDSNYHLLFTFYHISCQNSKDQNQLENIIGYSWLPLKQQFQFETTIQFTNSVPPSSTQPTSDNNDIYQSSNKPQICSTTFVNQVHMIKSGIYSLPISFEKLPSGYSSLNYSIYDTSSSNHQNETLFYLASNEQSPQSNEQISNSNIDPKNIYQNDRFMLNNVLNVNTVISNVTNSSINMTSNNSNSIAAQTSLNAATSGNSKSYFDVKLNLVSTIHTQDVYLERFISIANSNNSSSNRNGKNNLIETINYSDTALLKQAILDLCFASLEPLVKFLYIILDKLLFIMVNNQCLSTICLEVIARLVQKITDFLSTQNDFHKRNKLLIQYIKYSCNLPLISIVNQKYFHDEILTELLNILQPRSKNLTQDQLMMRDLVLRNLWFFNELIIKSLGLSLDAKKKQFKVNNNFKSAMNQSINFYFTKQLSQKFLVDLKTFIKLLTHEIFSLKQVDSPDNIKILNCSLSFLLNDLLSLIDRGYVFKKIDYFMREANKIMTILCKKFNSKDCLNSILLIHSMQLDFLRIITNHEHFVTLNLPFFPDLNELMIYLGLKNNPNMKNKQFNDNFTMPKLIIDSSIEYYQRHYLVGMILKQLFKSLHSPSSHIQSKSVSLLRNVLESHDIDPRLQHIKSKIAYMYFPFVNLIIHFIPFMTLNLKMNSKNNNFSSSQINKDPNQDDLACNLDIDNQFQFCLNNSNPSSSNLDNFHQLDELKDMLNDMNEFHMECEELRFFIDDMDNIENYIYNSSINDDVTDSDNLNELNSEMDNNENEKTSSQSKNKRNPSFSNKKTNSIVQNNFNNNNNNNGNNQDEIDDSNLRESNSKKLKPICSCVYLLKKTNLNASTLKKFDISIFSRETIQDLLICFMWIVKNLDKQLLFILFSKWPLTKINKILILIDLCVNVFEYKSTSWSSKRRNNLNIVATNNQTKPVLTSNSNLNKKQLNQSINNSSSSTSNSKLKNKIEDLLIGSSQNSRFEIMKKSKNSSSNSISTQNELLLNVVNAFSSNLANKTCNNNLSEMDELDESVKSILEGNLSTECLLIGLETIDLITKIIQNQQQQQSVPTSHSPGCTSSISGLNGLVSISNNYLSNCIQCNNMENNLMPNLLTNIMRLLLNALNLEQSTISLTNLFSFERALVTKFPELLFEEDTEYCADMCMRLLRHCTSPLQIVRSQASASLYFMMRQNFDIGNNFSRVKMQVTMSLSTLVAGTKIYNNGLSTNIDFNNSSSILMNVFNVNCLKKSLKTILFYSENDIELKESSFPTQVKDLVLNLSTILSDTVKMREHNDDPEMLIDLMHRIANCYQNSPDMRLIWLQNMAHKHLQNQNLVEAGQCLVHAAALVAEYLSMIENRSYLPVGCASFKNVSVNVLEESAISDDVLSEPYEEGICSGKYFTETGLIGLIEQSAVFLMHSQNYEAANELYKILIPIFEANKDIKKLSQVYSKLHDCFNKILLNNNRRLFGTYFRVGFYGDRFEDLNGEEFIYKEPGITKLAEIAHRLENFYTQKFGQGIVEIMKDSNNVDKNNLDLASKAYIQITYVEPYFDRWEMQKCESVFDKNYSLKRFIYATPFTLDGKAHGPLNQQYKRKTILTTERAFPYVKTRIKVIDKQQVILGPVEVAIEDLQKKVDELKNATLQEPADPKILQMVLQGCVGTTVNQGPLEMALTFLQPVSYDMITEHHNKLRLCFKEFSRRCAEALKKNKNLIGPDQFEYQREMEKNYNDLKIRINPLIENKLFKNNLPNINSKGEH